MTRENSALQCENLNARCANLGVSIEYHAFHITHRDAVGSNDKIIMLQFI